MRSSVTNIYREEDVERFYDSEDAHYRTFWDKAGSLHWGVFDSSTGSDFLKACANLNSIMARKSALDPSSNVIDLGCGNGNTALWLAASTGCRVVGVDLSGVRVRNANESLNAEGPQLQRRVAFRKASVTGLPFDAESFTHVWSQASLYHVPEKDKALREAYRVLNRDGVFVFDDLIKPRPNITDLAKQYVYDRLLFDTDYSFGSYQEALQEVGFEVVDSIDLSEHLATSYTRLAELARQTIDHDEEHFKALAFAYEQMIKCIENRDVGWAMYVCRKRPGRNYVPLEKNIVQWVYSSRDEKELAERYNQWAKTYDKDLSDDFGWIGPQFAVDTAVKFVPKDAKILDAGAGTGLVGKLLSEQGYDDLVAIDLSAGMLEEARKKNAYKELRQMDLAATLDFASDSFDAVISVGVLTVGHAPPSSLGELVRVTRPEGHVVFTLRPDVYEGGFKEKHAELESQGKWNLVEVTDPVQVLPKGEPDVFHQTWVYQVSA